MIRYQRDGKECISDLPANGRETSRDLNYCLYVDSVFFTLTNHLCNYEELYHALL